MQSKGTQIPYNNNSTIAMLDVGVKTFGQLIFNTEPYSQSVLTGAPTMITLQYCLNGESQGKIQISASAYSADNNPNIYSSEANIDSFFSKIIAANLVLKLPTTQKTGYRCLITKQKCKITTFLTSHVGFLKCTRNSSMTLRLALCLLTAK